jgi:putative hydrolase of the HAD superfamily
LRGAGASPIFAAMSAPAQNHTDVTKHPDFQHISAWMFDLDHTLYTLDAEKQKAMEEKICLFVQRHFGIARAPAWELQKRYLKEHGSTLAGLTKHHGVDADAYHDFVNDIDAMALSENVPLRLALARLPGRRFIFTNNCGRYGRKVLDILGVADLFDGIVDAKILGGAPKPAASAYDTLLAETGATAAEAVLFDDSMRNLVPAKALGMTTVWFNNGGGQSHWRMERQSEHIDYETDDLVRFLQHIRI